MRLDDQMINCSRCSRQESMAIVECVECEHQYCAQCLLEHQIDSSKSSHKLVSLARREEPLTEINNNELNPKQDQSTGNSRLVQIENEISKTFEFYQQALTERKEYVLKEMSTITQYAVLNHAQSIGKQLQIQYQLDMKKQTVEKELNVDYELYNQYDKQIEQLRQEQGGNSEEMNVLTELMAKIESEVKMRLGLIKELNNLLAINNQLIEKLKSADPLATVEFVSNFSAIQTSIRNTFGYVRINNQAVSEQRTEQSNSAAAAASYQKELSVLCDMNAFAKLNNGSNENVNPMSCNSQSSFNTGPLSCNSQSAASFISGTTESINMQSPISYMRKEQSHEETSQSGVSMMAEAIKKVITNSLGNEAVSNYLSSLQSSANDSDLINQSVVNQSESTDNEQLIQLSAGSTASSKSSKSSIAASATTSKHPLSHLYANFINNNPKLNTFNYDDGDISTKSGSKLTSGSSSSANSPPQHQQLNRSKMIYHCKFGEFGITDGQFTEPSGVAINTNNDIIVADTNSHRIQIFDKEGNFKFKFGECGKRDGQLLYPNRVSIVKQTGDIVVTERSPTHQIQIYNKYGQFLRKFGANILQHPRGVYVDYKSRIVVVECKVMRVIIFDLYGNVLNKFNCSKYLEFPNGVCCSNPTNAGSNQREEIYISDNRAHCIKVFDYNGNFLRQIGGQGITNYPIGVGINSNNEILVADNHNNFNLTVFTQEGKLINALESKVKHAQCFDVGLMDDGSIVLASKDYRIYVYKYTNTLEYLASNSSSSVSIEKSAASNSNSQQQLFSPSSSTTSLTTNSSIGYELFESNLNSNSSIFGNFMVNNSDKLFGYESSSQSDVEICRSANNNDDDDFNNMSNLNHSFSTLLNLSNSHNTSNLASMLNGFL